MGIARHQAEGKESYAAHPGRPCDFATVNPAKPSIDSRFKRCALGWCQNVWVIPVQPAPSQAHSRTSRAAAGSTDRQRGRQAVWDAFRKAGAVHANPVPFGVVGGLTDEECAEVTRMSPNAARPRRIELLRDGLLVDSGYTRKTRSNRSATVWMSIS